MAWSTEIREAGYGVREETLTLASGASTDVSSTKIDFIPAGVPFQIVANLAETDITLAVEADVEIDASFDDATYTVLVANAMTTISANTQAYSFNPRKTAGDGWAPYLKLRIDPSGNTAGETIAVRVIYPLVHPAKQTGRDEGRSQWSKRRNRTRRISP